MGADHEKVSSALICADPRQKNPLHGRRCRTASVFLPRMDADGRGFKSVFSATDERGLKSAFSATDERGWARIQERFFCHG
jgi:hypothetical protein